MEYSDGISVISSDNHKTVKSERDNTNKLSKKGLSINDTKTERYTINRNNNSWKKCKLLGSLLDTDEEIKRRKSLGINAANNLEHLFKNKHLTTATKMKVMDTYVKPIFMYTSELWTTNKSHEMSIDAFQRKLIRKHVFDIKWPNKMSNEQLYEKTNAESYLEKKDNSSPSKMVRETS